MNITANQRIALNILATYGRSIFALICGLVTARWALEALGDINYGLLGLIGGLTIFIGIFNINEYNGHGIGVIIQGSFLAIFDTYYAVKIKAKGF